MRPGLACRCYSLCHVPEVPECGCDLPSGNNYLVVATELMGMVSCLLRLCAPFRYKLRRPITLRDVSSSYRVMAAWGDGIAPAGVRGAGNARHTLL